MHRAAFLCGYFLRMSSVLLLSKPSGSFLASKRPAVRARVEGGVAAQDARQQAARGAADQVDFGQQGQERAALAVVVQDAPDDVVGRDRRSAFDFVAEVQQFFHAGRADKDTGVGLVLVHELVLVGLVRLLQVDDRAGLGGDLGVHVKQAVDKLDIIVHIDRVAVACRVAQGQLDDVRLGGEEAGRDLGQRERADLLVVRLQDQAQARGVGGRAFRPAGRARRVPGR